jgi:predicted Zn-dependent protease
MGHEIAHVVAKHGNERMSPGLATQMGGVALATAFEVNQVQTRELWMTAFGVGTQVGVLLPYSRLHESEADHFGLVFMAMAGYDSEYGGGILAENGAAEKGRSTAAISEYSPV